jgi:hypothetical protein
MCVRRSKAQYEESCVDHVQGRAYTIAATHSRLELCIQHTVRSVVTSVRTSDLFVACIGATAAFATDAVY